MQVLTVDFTRRNTPSDPRISKPVNDDKFLFPTFEAEEFATNMGHAVWLMSMSKRHRNLPVHEIEARISVPIFLGQYEVYFNGKQPAAFLTWARVSDAVLFGLNAGRKVLAHGDWRSGDNLVVVDCISPFQSKDRYIRPFLNGK